MEGVAVRDCNPWQGASPQGNRVKESSFRDEACEEVVVLRSPGGSPGRHMIQQGKPEQQWGRKRGTGLSANYVPHPLPRLI
jgi:hypothetical protein